jgi:hypothetical protein
MTEPDVEVDQRAEDPGNVNGELINEPLLNSAVVGVAYVSPEGADATGGVAVDGLTATVTITGGSPDETRTLDWGDDTTDELVLSATGDGTASHTYAAAGTYTVAAKDSAGNTLTSEQVTVTEPVTRSRSKATKA